MFKSGQGGDAEGHSIWEKKQESEIDQESSRVENECWKLLESNAHIYF